MKAPPDPLVSTGYPDRLHYSTGELLGADDFRDEQTYHRRQLARALLHLHGSGVIAGLRVAYEQKPGTNGVPDEVELRVAPGLALDHAGRLVEVPREASLRLARWYGYIAKTPPSSTELDAGDLRASWRADATAPRGGVVVADVFLSFHECPRGYTPAFASGPFDALDASQPSRVRDGYELSLVLRREADADLPVAQTPWSKIAGTTLAERVDSAKELSLDMWYQSEQPAPENPAGVDPAAVLLARVRMPAAQNANAGQAPTADWSAAAWPTREQDAAQHANRINNGVRHMMLPPSAVRYLLTT